MKPNKTTQLEDIMEIYLVAKRIEHNPQHLTSYSVDYIMNRESGLPHKMTIQKMKKHYLNKEYGK